MSRARQEVNITADLAILTIRESRMCVLLVERANDPFLGLHALPGGFMRAGETLEETAYRELCEETGLESTALHLEQLGVYSSPGRDPRAPRVVTCAYLAIAPALPRPTAGSDARFAQWTPVGEASDLELAFDHSKILRDAVELARDKLQFTTVATAFCSEEFTIADLRAVYEAVWGVALDKPNFHRKITDVDGFIVQTGNKRSTQTGRPAALYKAGPAKVLSPPMLRPGK